MKYSIAEWEKVLGKSLLEELVDKDMRSRFGNPSVAESDIHNLYWLSKSTMRKRLPTHKNERQYKLVKVLHFWKSRPGWTGYRAIDMNTRHQIVDEIKTVNIIKE